MKPALRVRVGALFLQRKKLVPQLTLVRRSGEILPPSQYDVPIPRRLQLSYVLKEYWEIIPLFVVTATALSIMVAAIIWACQNKVTDCNASPFTEDFLTALLAWWIV